MLVAEVHHREECVHQSLAQPSLCILAYLGVGIPSVAGVAGQVVVLAHGRAAHLYPWLQALHGMAYLPGYAGDVVSALLAAHLQVPVFGVSDVVEMDAVDVVSSGYLAAYLCQIVARAAVFGVHISVGSYLSDELRELAAQVPASQCIPFAHGYGYHPGVEFHASLVAFVDGKLQGVVAWRFAGESGEASVPWFQGGWVDHGAAHAGLQQHGVDLSLLQAVENLAEFLLLLSCRDGRLGVGVGPVSAADGGEPYGAHLVLGSLLAYEDAARLFDMAGGGCCQAVLGCSLPGYARCSLLIW